VSIGRVAAVVLVAALTASLTTAFVPTHAAPKSPPGVSALRSPHGKTNHGNEAVGEHFRLIGTAHNRIFPNVDNYAARSTSSGPLLLFLPATGHHPSQYQDFLAAARTVGYRVLALDYWNNGMSVARTCGTNAGCYTEVQRNRLDGSHASRFSSVNPANSIVSRLRDALSHLRRVDPSGHWQQFEHGRGIDWSNIVVSGHSQGGGEAAFISHLHLVRGVLMFSSPVDSDQGVDASWMASKGATPASRMYGLDDSGDVFNSRVVASWNALGMNSFGPASNANTTAWGHAHELISHIALGTPNQAHLRDITDDVPLIHGKPVYAPVWSWMLDQPFKASDAGALS
jgi:hypothetical protein